MLITSLGLPSPSMELRWSLWAASRTVVSCWEVSSSTISSGWEFNLAETYPVLVCTKHGQLNWMMSTPRGSNWHLYYRCLELMWWCWLPSPWMLRSRSSSPWTSWRTVSPLPPSCHPSNAVHRNINREVTLFRPLYSTVKLILSLAGLGAKNFAMLGLGDIVLPGVFIALLLRYDVR